MRIDTYIGTLFSRWQNLPLDICACNNVQIKIGEVNNNNDNNNNDNSNNYNYNNKIKQYAGFK